MIEQHAPKRDDKPEIASPALRAEVHKIEVNEVKEKLTELNKRAEVFLLEEYARLRKPVGAVGFWGCLIAACASRTLSYRRCERSRPASR
jgi:tetrahydromethanopterin S-methyltransferase subunit G